MKLSELMFQGAKETKPIHGHWLEDRPIASASFIKEGDCHACAVGAAYYAYTGGRVRQTSSCSEMYRALPEFRERNVPCPAFGELLQIGLPRGCNRSPEFGTLMDLCSHLFEEHRWTREAVAMWLESREKAKEREHERENSQAHPEGSAQGAEPSGVPQEEIQAAPRKQTPDGVPCGTSMGGRPVQ